MPTVSRLANSSFDLVGEDDHVAHASVAVVRFVDLDRFKDIDGSLRSRRNSMIVGTVVLEAVR